MSRTRHRATPLRSFVALELPETFRQRLAALGELLRPTAPDARFVRPESTHLTLRFLGETTPAQVEQLRSALHAGASACPPSDATITGLGLFPSRGNPRVLWLGLQLEAPVLALQAACEAAAVAAGFAAEPRPFVPHLTLARWRDRAVRPALMALPPQNVRLDSLVLFRSELHPQGASYTPLHTFALGAP